MAKFIDITSSRWNFANCHPLLLTYPKIMFSYGDHRFPGTLSGSGAIEIPIQTPNEDDRARVGVALLGPLQCLT